MGQTKDEELRAYFGFKIMMGLVPLPDNTDLPQSGEPGYDRLGKVRGIMGKVQDRFTALYKPHCECAIDEAMIPFQGRSSLKQYMPAKPVKRGINV